MQCVIHLMMSKKVNMYGKMNLRKTVLLMVNRKNPSPTLVGMV
jgi:hypothetical protein